MKTILQLSIVALLSLVTLSVNGQININESLSFVIFSENVESDYDTLTTSTMDDDFLTIEIEKLDDIDNSVVETFLIEGTKINETQVEIVLRSTGGIDDFKVNGNLYDDVVLENHEGFDTKYTYTLNLNGNSQNPVEIFLDADGNTTVTINFGLSTLTESSFTSNPVDLEICSNNNNTFSATPPAGGTNVQWQVNQGSGFVDVVDNAIYSGSNTNDLLVNNPNISMNGYIYKCTAMYNTTATQSTEATLTVNSAPETGAINGNPNPSTYETLTYMVSNTTGSTYAWEVTGGTIAEDNGNSVDIMWSGDGFGSLCVVETATNACAGDEVCLQVAVIVNELQGNSKFGIYPNPSKGLVKIQGVNNASIEIINIAGKTIKTVNSTTNNVEIDLNNEPKGIYFVKVSTAKAVTTQKLVIE